MESTDSLSGPLPLPHLWVPPGHSRLLLPIWILLYFCNWLLFVPTCRAECWGFRRHLDLTHILGALFWLHWVSQRVYIVLNQFVIGRYLVGIKQSQIVPERLRSLGYHYFALCFNLVSILEVWFLPQKRDVLGIPLVHRLQRRCFFFVCLPLRSQVWVLKQSLFFYYLSNISCRLFYRVFGHLFLMKAVFVYLLVFRWLLYCLNLNYAIFRWNCITIAPIFNHQIEWFQILLFSFNLRHLSLWL